MPAALQRGRELAYRFTASCGCAGIEQRASMGESWGWRGKGILKAEFQTPVSPWVKLHREIFWQNTKGTKMKAQPRICIANDICLGGTAELALKQGCMLSGGPKPRFPGLVSWLEVHRDRPGVTCMGEPITAC